MFITVENTSITITVIDKINIVLNRYLSFKFLFWINIEINAIMM